MKTSNKWLYTIKIKEHFGGKTTPELVAKLCSILEHELSRINKAVGKSNLDYEEIGHICQELGEMEDNFNFLKQLADGTIPENEWNNYGFDGNFELWFNDYLEQLYDLADKRVVDKYRITHKFLFLE